jgi:hypothetical protein
MSSIPASRKLLTLILQTNWQSIHFGAQVAKLKTEVDKPVIWARQHLLETSNYRTGRPEFTFEGCSWLSVYDQQLTCKRHVDTRNILARFACYIARNSP